MASSAVAPEAVASGQNTDGWFVDLTFTGDSVGGTYDFGLGSNNETDNAKVVFTATSSSFDADGVAGTTTRTFYGTKVLREAYPNEANLQEDDSSGDLVVRIAVSDFIYAGETVTVDIAAGFHTDLVNGANTEVIGLTVTNNATLSYPKTIARWATVPYQRVDSDFLIEVVAFNQFAKNGKPVACVKFEVEDQSGNSVTHTATGMNISTLDFGDGSVDAEDVWTYSFTVPIATLSDQDVLTCNFEAFPHIGDASSTRDSRTTGDGVSPANENLGPLPMYNDKGDTARRYAHVDPNTGSDGLQGVFTSEAAALASPYATIGAASAAFTGTPSEIPIITLSADNHNWTSVSGGSTLTWTLIRPSAGTPTIFGAANAASSNVKLAFHGCSFNDNGATGQLRGSVSTSYLWVHNAPDVNHTGLAAIYQWVAQYWTRGQSATATAFRPFSSNRSPMALARGNAFNRANVGSELGPYMAVGNTGLQFFNNTNTTTGAAVPQNTICAFNRRFDAQNENVIRIQDYNATATSGHAYVGNIVEVTGAGSSPAVAIAADSMVENTDNVILWHNVVVGQRSNLGYNDATAARGTRNNWSQIGNLHGNQNIKTDTFSSNPQSANILNWPWYYQTKCRDGGFDFETSGLGFEPEFYGVKISITPTVNFTNPQSFYQGGGGNGDYSIQSGFGFEAISSQDQVITGWTTYGAIQDTSGGGGGSHINALLLGVG